MIRPKARLFKAFILFSCTCLCRLPVFADNLRIGSAAVKITPPVGTSMAGYYYERGVEKIHDDLYAKALVIENNGVKIAIVECDLINISANLVGEARKMAESITGIKASNIMIGATHSHTGPVIPGFRERFSPKSKSADLLAAYIKQLPTLIAESIKRANDLLKPAVLSFGSGYEDSVSFNRRYFMNDGTVGWNPGKLNPRVVKPAGPIDPRVAVLFAQSIEGKAIATFVNFALHLDCVSGSEVSSDIPFTLSALLGKIKGSDMVTIWSQGCSGNINHVNVNSPVKQGGHQEAARIGTILAGEVIKTYSRLSGINVKTIQVYSETIELPLAEYSKKDLPWAKEIAAKYGKQNAAPFLDFVKAFKVLELDERNGKPMPAEIQVFTLGDSCAIISLPAEIFTEIGMYIRSRSPYPFTIITELTNGAIGYIPDRKGYAEGNYESVVSRVAPGSGEILASNVLRILYQLKQR